MDSDTDTPRDEELRTEVLSRLDNMRGTLDALFNGLHAADEADLYVESDEDRAADIKNYLGQASEEMDSEEPDPAVVLTRVEMALAAANAFRRGMGEDLREFSTPDYVGTGVYATFGEYAKHVEQTIISIEHYTEEWAHESQ